MYRDNTKSQLLLCVFSALISVLINSCSSTTPEKTKIEVIAISLEPAPIIDTIKDSAILEMGYEVPLFDFDTYEIEKYEGCTDSLVYPGGGSGPTISCGLDLANIGSKNAYSILNGVVDDTTLGILMKASQYRGDGSIRFIANNQVHVGKHTAVMICNSMKKMVWREVLKKYPTVMNAPSAVKSAMLSVCVHVGTSSSRLKGLQPLIEGGRWGAVADHIAKMDLDLKGGRLNSIHNRRVAEASKIRVELNPPKVYEIDYN